MEYRTGFTLWRGRDGGLADWALDGCRLISGRIVPAPGEAVPAHPRLSEEIHPACLALSPPEETAFPFFECVPSWNALVPEGSSLEISLRARCEDGWTRWYSMGVWAAGGESARRGFLAGQEDEAGDVATDTLRLSAPGTALQARVHFFCRPGGRPPELKALSLAYSLPKPRTAAWASAAQDPGLWGQFVFGVPERSQMVYPDGGDSWCSPVSVAMVLGYWKGGGFPTDADIRACAAGVYDTAYGGCGNWSFNAAFAGGEGMEAYVLRFPRLADLEPWIAAGVPVVLSVAWDNREERVLSGAPRAMSAGHLSVLVGFDERGDPVMNEPAAASDAGVRRTYARKELEVRWLEASGGAAYLIFPEGRAVPAFPGGKSL